MTQKTYLILCLLALVASVKSHAGDIYGQPDRKNVNCGLILLLEFPTLC